MRTKTSLFQAAGLRFSAARSAFVAFLLLWVTLSLAAGLLLHFSLLSAILGAFAAAFLHWVAIVLHHLGHAWAARRAGYPMTGVRFWGLLAVSRYPSDEPQLPATIHIQRALGGPLGSLFASFVSAGLVWALRLWGGLFWWLALFFLLDNLLTFTLGAFLPLSFTDGGTILTWLRKR